MTVAVAFLAAAVSCVDNVPRESEIATMTMSFTASTGTADTRTVLVDRVKVYWEDGDRIAVSGASEPFVTALDTPSPSATFDGEAETADIYHAVYPYSCLVDWADGLALLNLPQVQPAAGAAGAGAAGVGAGCTAACC